MLLYFKSLITSEYIFLFNHRAIYQTLCYQSFTNKGIKKVYENGHSLFDSGHLITLPLLLKGEEAVHHLLNKHFIFHISFVSLIINNYKCLTIQ